MLNLIKSKNEQVLMWRKNNSALLVEEKFLPNNKSLNT